MNSQKGFTISELLIVISAMVVIYLSGMYVYSLLNRTIEQEEFTESIRQLATTLDDANSDTRVSIYTPYQASLLNGFPLNMKYIASTGSIKYKNNIDISTGLIPLSLLISQPRLGNLFQGFFVGAQGLDQATCNTMLNKLWNEFQIIQVNGVSVKLFDNDLSTVSAACINFASPIILIRI